MAKLGDEFAKGFEAFVKAYLDERFQGAMRNAGMYAITRNRHIVSDREASENVAQIYTGIERINGHIIQICRGGNIVTDDARVSTRETMLLVESGIRKFRLQALDVIYYIVW